MGAQFLTVAEDSGNVIGAFKLDVLTLAGSGLGQGDFVTGGTPPVIGTTILAIQGVSGVGQGYFSEGFAGFGKERFLQNSQCTHDCSSLFNAKSIGSY